MKRLSERQEASRVQKECDLTAGVSFVLMVVVCDYRKKPAKDTGRMGAFYKRRDERRMWKQTACAAEVRV